MKMLTDIISSLVGKDFTIMSVGPAGLPNGSIGTQFVVQTRKGIFDQVFGGTWEQRSTAFGTAFGEFVK